MSEKSITSIDTIPKHLEKFDPFQAMDALDDELIIAEIEGRIVDKWVYHFPGAPGEKEVWGLSKVGVDQACRVMAAQGEAIREENIEWTIDPTDNRYVLFKGFASRVIVSKEGIEAVLDRAAGTKRQCTMVVKRSGITKDKNAFWFEQGTVKALRNARSRLLSEEVVGKIMAMAKEKGKTREVAVPPISPPHEKQEAPTGRTISEPQQKRFFAIAKSTGATTEKIKEWLLREFGFAHTNEITGDVYNDICDRVAKELSDAK